MQLCHLNQRIDDFIRDLESLEARMELEANGTRFKAPFNLLYGLLAKPRVGGDQRQETIRVLLWLR